MSKTKADVLSSAEEIVDEVSFEEQDWYPKVRALTDAEFSKAQAKMFRHQKIGASRASIEQEGIDPQEQVSMDLGALIDNEFEARVSVVASGMVEDWSESEVRKIPFPGAIETLSNKILELGGHDLYGGLKREVRHNVTTFRKERGGSGDGSASNDRDSASSESTEDDNGPEALPDDSHGSPAREATG